MLRLLAAGALLAVIVASWLMFGRSQDNSDTPAQAQEPASASQVTGTAPTGGAAGEKVGTSLPAPVRMSSDTSAASESGDTLAEIFETEEVGKPVAVEREEMVRGVTERLMKEGEYTAKITAQECRAKRCRIKVAGEEKGVSTLLAAMQSESGFYGKAKNMMMSRDGDEFHVYLEFEEPAEN